MVSWSRGVLRLYDAAFSSVADTILCYYLEVPNPRCGSRVVVVAPVTWYQSLTWDGRHAARFEKKLIHNRMSRGTHCSTKGTSYFLCRLGFGTGSPFISLSYTSLFYFRPVLVSPGSSSQTTTQVHDQTTLKLHDCIVFYLVCN